MVFISELIGKPVVDFDGERLGSLSDLIGRFQHDLPHPVIVGIVVKQHSQQLYFSYADVAIILAPAVSLN